MSTTIRIPIDLRNPQVSSNAGNAFWTVVALTARDAGHWAFLKDVLGNADGVVTIPKNVSVTPNAKIVAAIAANATSGVASLRVETAKAADAATLNPASLAAETTQDITVPATARLRRDVTFPASGSLATTVVADDILMVRFAHRGADANDTLAVNTELHGLWLQIDLA